jgi:hypothetical protein
MYSDRHLLKFKNKSSASIFRFILKMEAAYYSDALGAID